MLFVEKQLDRINRLLDKPSANRLPLVQRGRAIASRCIANQETNGISTSRMREIGRRGFLLEQEIELARQHHFVLPHPRVSPVVVDREPDVFDFVETVRPTRRWGNAWDAKQWIEQWLLKGESVGVLAGKFRVLNMGEVDALWKAVRRVRHFVVAVASEQLCLVDQEFAEVQYVPPLEGRMQQLLDFRFPDGRKIDYIFQNNADPILLARGEILSYIPFYFFHLPDYDTQAKSLIDGAMKSRSYFDDAWPRIVRLRSPSHEERRTLKKFRWLLTNDSEKQHQLQTQDKVFGLLGGRIGWLRPHKYGDTISSTEIIRRWKLAPPESFNARTNYYREEHFRDMPNPYK